MLFYTCKYSHNQQKIKNKIKDYWFFLKTSKVKITELQKHIFKFFGNINKRKKNKLGNI